MSEEVSVPVVDQEQVALNGLQAEYQQLCMQAGEKQYVASITRKELIKINLRLKKINQKANGIIQSLKMKQEAKAKAESEVKTEAVPKLKNVKKGAK